MRSHKRKPGLVGHGRQQPGSAPGVRLVCVYMGGKLFERVRDKATRDEMSVSATVRDLVCDGFTHLDSRSDT